MASAFSGFIITLINLFYNVGYRELEGFSKALLVNVSSIIFTTMLVLLAMGFIFYLLTEYISKGSLLFSVFIIAITVVLIILTIGSQKNGFSSGFDGLYIGLELITGTLTAFLVPYFSTHTKIFMTET
jgi:hypothetical protein